MIDLNNYKLAQCICGCSYISPVHNNYNKRNNDTKVGIELVIELDENKDEFYFIHCGNCKVKTPVSYNLNYVIDCWNSKSNLIMEYNG